MQVSLSFQNSSSKGLPQHVLCRMMSTEVEAKQADQDGKEKWSLSVAETLKKLQTAASEDLAKERECMVLARPSEVVESRATPKIPRTPQMGRTSAKSEGNLRATLGCGTCHGVCVCVCVLD